MLFISGQIPLNPETSEPVTGDIVVQARQVMANLEAILKEADFTFSDIVKTTVFLKDFSDFQKMNEIYAEYFTVKPARSTIEVSYLPKGVSIEIDAIAVKE